MENQAFQNPHHHEHHEHHMQTQDQLTAHHAKCFLVTCMDFRLIDDITHFMDKHGYNNNYDQFILAGGSLGLNQDKFPHWGQTLLDHMNIGQSLHEFRQIIIIDHKQCGAYKKFLNVQNEEEQDKLHHQHLQLAYEKLSQKFPNFQFKAYLMDLHGQCQTVHIDHSKNKHIQRVASQQQNFLSEMVHYDHLTQQQ